MCVVYISTHTQCLLECGHNLVGALRQLWPSNSVG
jgi:hypothetical protein